MKKILMAIGAMLLLGCLQAASANPNGDSPNLSADVTGPIQTRLEARYPLAKATADGNDIVTAGAVLVLQKDNLVMNKVGFPSPTPNVYKEGAISQVGLLGALGKLTSFSFGGAVATTSRTFVRGEKFWVTQIKAQSDGIVFQFMSDPINDVRYHATLKFPYANSDASAAEQAANGVADVLALDGPVDAGAPALAAAAMPTAVAAAAVIPKTIALGQSIDDVVAAFGQPGKIVQLGAKEIYYYPDMKVIFVHHKVSDIQ